MSRPPSSKAQRVEFPPSDELRATLDGFILPTDQITVLPGPTVVWTREINGHTVSARAVADPEARAWKRSDHFAVSYGAEGVSDPFSVPEISSALNAFADVALTWTAEDLTALSAYLAHARDMWDGGAIRNEIVPISALGEDAVLLAPTFAEVEYLYGEPCRIRRIPGPVEDAYSIEFPAALARWVEGRYSYLLKVHRMSYPMRQYLAELGFGWVGDQTTCVPTVASFVKIAQHKGVLSGFCPEMIPMPSHLSFRDWTGVVLDGRYPATVLSEKRRGLRLLSKVMAVPSKWGFHGPLHHFRAPSTALAHDVGQHAMATHRIPADCREELQEIAGTILQQEPAPAKHVALFFEGKLTRDCLDIFREIEQPSDFEAAYRKKHSEFVAALQDWN